MISKKNTYTILSFSLLFFTIIELPAPIIIYGTQIFVIAFLVLCRFLLYPKIKIIILIYSILMLLILTTLSYYQYSYLSYTEIFWLNSVRTEFWILMAILSYDFFKSLNYNIYFKVINLIILLSATSVITQTISFHMLKYELDYSILLGGDSVRSIATLGDLVYRPTGLTAEPAIHSGIMVGLLCLRYILDKRIDLIFIIGITSILLTFSTFGILVSISIFAIVYSKNIITFLLGGVLAWFGSLFFLESLLDRWKLFLSGDDGSNNVKIDVFNDFISNNQIFLFGYGFIGKSPTAPSFYEALYDMTLYFNIFIYWGIFIGIFLLFIIIFLLMKNKFSIKEKLFISLVFIKLSGPTFMFFSFFCMLLFIFHLKKREN